MSSQHFCTSRSFVSSLLQSEIPKKRRSNWGFSKTPIRNSDEESQTSGPSLNDLPSTIVFDIVLKLPVKSIAMCKCVCRSWRSLISDPNFAELHFAQSKPCTLVRDTNDSRISRSLYLLENEDFARPDSGFCSCSADRRCEHGRFDAEVKVKLKIPLGNVQAMLDKVGNSYDSRAVFYVNRKGSSRNLVKLESWYSHWYDVVNSCNGLLCLSRKYQSDTENVVCNPVSGEFIHLPENSSDCPDEKKVFAVYIGFGFSPKHGQYKVVRMFTVAETNPGGGRSFRKVAQVLTIGTNSWRSLDVSVGELGNLMSPAYLDGALYWFFLDRSQNYKVASFDLDEELFQVHAVLPRPRFRGGTPFLSLRAVSGRVFLYTEFAVTHVDIWVMNVDGISKSWPRLFSVDISELHRWSREPHRYNLLCCLNNEAVVLLGGPRSEIIYYNKSEGLRFKQLKFQGFVSKFEAISHTPSFVSLKDIVKQGDVEVLNINTGCGKLKLSEETYPLLLRGARN